MYLGHIVELAETEELFQNPLHPYTQALLEAVPIPDPVVEAERGHKIIAGEIPSPMNPPSGCVFHPRCPLAVESCKRDFPAFREVKPGHWVACTETDRSARMAEEMREETRRAHEVAEAEAAAAEMARGA